MRSTCKLATMEQQDLLARLSAAGFKPTNIWDGEEDMPPTVASIQELDQCHLWVTRNGNQHWLFLVLGNGPGELVSDWGVPADPEAAKLLDDTITAHSREWEEWL